MKPLEGITVLEISTMITASFAAMMMAEQGATVIKVEPMNVGDPMRYIGANKGGISSLFANCNRGKRSIRVNLKEAEGQQLMRELIPKVDIFIHNRKYLLKTLKNFSSYIKILVNFIKNCEEK